tara:strand:- start:4544 stop:5302 length:759 start_codon:yes stop_codon:yes gene_type:complete
MYYSKVFKRFKNINHCFFSRRNGFSKGIYKSLNCGKGSKDKKKLVNKNLIYVSKKMKINYNNLILMNQTHSNKVLIINKKNKNKKKFNSDAIITNLKKISLAVLTADCVPIILYDSNKNTIACIHAGWKGAISGIVENTLKKMKKINYNHKIFACIGPCIGKKSYEVEKNFVNIFLKKNKSNLSFFKKKNKKKFFFDIRSYVAKKLNENKIFKIDNINYDTCKNFSNFFSYRRSQKLGEKDYGRCISVISLI